MKDYAPVKHTCPDIDKAIKQVKTTQQSLEEAMSYARLSNIDDCKSSIRYAYQSISGIIDILEELRSDNSALREWGNALAKEVEKLEEFLDECRESDNH